MVLLWARRRGGPRDRRRTGRAVASDDAVSNKAITQRALGSVLVQAFGQGQVPHATLSLVRKPMAVFLASCDSKAPVGLNFEAHGILTVAAQRSRRSRRGCGRLLMKTLLDKFLLPAAAMTSCEDGRASPNQQASTAAGYGVDALSAHIGEDRTRFVTGVKAVLAPGTSPLLRPTRRPPPTSPELESSNLVDSSDSSGSSDSDSDLKYAHEDDPRSEFFRDSRHAVRVVAIQVLLEALRSSFTTDVDCVVTPAGYSIVPGHSRFAPAPLSEDFELLHRVVDENAQAIAYRRLMLVNVPRLERAVKEQKRVMADLVERLSQASSRAASSRSAHSSRPHSGIRKSSGFSRGGTARKVHFDQSVTLPGSGGEANLAGNDGKLETGLDRCKGRGWTFFAFLAAAVLIALTWITISHCVSGKQAAFPRPRITRSDELLDAEARAEKVRAEAIAPLVAQLKAASTGQRAEAAAALAKLAAPGKQPSGQTQVAIRKQGAVPLLIKSLTVEDSRAPEERAAAADALRALAWHNPNCALRSGWKTACHRSCFFCGSAFRTPKSAYGSGWARPTRCGTCPRTPRKDRNWWGAPARSRCWWRCSSRGGDQEKEPAAAAFRNLCYWPGNRARIAEAGAVPKLVRLLDVAGNRPETRRAAAGALRGVAMDDAFRLGIAKAGALAPLSELLRAETTNSATRRPALWRSSSQAPKFVETSRQRSAV